VRITARVVVATAVLATLGSGAPAARAAAPAGPWDAFNLSPASRTVQPVAIRTSGGAVTNAAGVLSGQPTTLGAGGYVTLDFGKEVGGFTTLHLAASSTTGQNAGLTYSEWGTYSTPTKSDSSNGSSNIEPPVQYSTAPGAGVDTQTAAPAAVAAAPALTGASWIWSTPGSNNSAAVGTIYLRKTFTVPDPSAVTAARLRINVDDSHVTYVNGQQVTQSGGIDAWRVSQIVDVKPYLVAGANVIAIAATNTSAGASGVVAKLQIDLAPSGQIVVNTDGTWKASATNPAGWTTLGYDDSGWGGAAVAGAYPISPWGSVSDPGNGAGTNSSTTLTAAAAAGDTSVTVASATYITPGTKLTVGGESETVTAVAARVLTIAPALAAAHAAGSAVRETSAELRGGFRYLTIENPGPGPLVLDGAAVRITFEPDAADLRAYPNYFYSNDPLLNRIWYAGAYTVQTNIIANDQGRVWTAPAFGWDNGGVVGELGSSVLVDGAKRDRTVWPGDLGISLPTDFASLGDLTAVKNALQTLYNHQAANGALPYAGPQVNSVGNSDAYHMWTLIGTATYYQYSGDRAWLDSVWGRYKLALTYITNKIGADGLLNVTASADWARTNSGGKNVEAEAIMYRTLTACRALATTEGDSALAASCDAKAAALKTAVNGTGYWNAATGLYRDTPTSTLYPQDGNSLAVWYGLVGSPAQATAISHALDQRWTPVGALTPEKSSTSVHPFPGSMEALAHFAAGDDTKGLDLIRLEWGYMLNAPNSTSTFWEGYKTDGTSDYSDSYISSSHGWSTGPTSALTFYVLGIQPDPGGGPAYSLVPHPGDLRHVEGQLSTPAGTITQSYDADPATGSFASRYSAPAGAVTTVAVPSFGKAITLRLDGRLAWDGTQAVGAGNAHSDGTYVYVDGAAGAHELASCPTASCGTLDVGGSVPSVLALTIGAPASFGAFTPGVGRVYTAATTATVGSTAGDATLSVADPSATATGHLVNGAFALPQPLLASAGGAFAPVGGAASPTALKHYDAPVSNDGVTLSFQQSIGATDALRTGAYGKTLTFTLSTTAP
jgi:hypothetical protein